MNRFIGVCSISWILFSIPALAAESAPKIMCDVVETKEGDFKNQSKTPFILEVLDKPQASSHALKQLKGFD